MDRLTIPFTLKQVRAERARRSLSEFAKQAWHVVEPGSAYIHGWHIDAICEHLEAVTRGEIRNLLINMPPRHGKSLLVSVFWPCWVWARQPETRWLFSSYAQSLSIRDSVKCRRLLMSPWYQENFGHMFQLTGDQNEKIRFENSRTGYRLSTSVGGAATGEGGDFVVCDDPHNVLEAESDTIRQGTLEWWDEVMSTRGNDPKTVRRVIVMQRVHEDDLSGHVLAQGGYEHLCLPAEYERESKPRVTALGWQDPRDEEGALLWPERFGPDEIAEMKMRLGSRAAAGQLQQSPAPKEGAMIKRAWWKFYRALPDRFDEVVQSWDMTFKDAATSDYVVGQVWGRVGASKYLLDSVRERMDFPASLQALKTLSAKWKQAGLKLIEDKANGPAIIAAARKEISGIVAVEPDGSKEARLAAVSPQIEAGNVYLPDPELAPWVHDFIEECSTFPGGKFKDQVDSMTQALNRFTTNSVGEFTDDMVQAKGQTIAGALTSGNQW